MKIKLELVNIEKTYHIEEELPSGKLEAVVIEYCMKVGDQDVSGYHIENVTLNGERVDGLEELVYRKFKEVRK